MRNFEIRINALTGHQGELREARVAAALHNTIRAFCKAEEVDFVVKDTHGANDDGASWEQHMEFKNSDVQLNVEIL